MTAPLELYQELRAYKRSRALSVAIELGVLEALNAGPVSITELASKLSCPPAWLSPLLGCLVNLGLVRKVDSGFVLTDTGRDTAKDQKFLAIAAYHTECFESWGALPRLIHGESGGAFHRQRLHDEQFCHAYLRALDAIATANLPFLDEQCRPYLSGEVIDIGAGPATLCRSLAARGQATVTALDLPPVAAASQALFGKHAALTWVGADLFEWDPPHRYDAVFCSHLLEYVPRDSHPGFFQRIQSMLKTGGHFCLGVFLRRQETEPELDLFELSTGLNGEQPGAVCTEAELETSLQKAGFQNIRIHPFPPGPSYSEFLVTMRYH